MKSDDPRWAAKLQWQRNDRLVKRAEAKRLGVCRECGQKTPQTCCKRCYAKAALTRPDALEAFNRACQEDRMRLQFWLQPSVEDRKQRGKPSRALAWALVMHRERQEQI